MGHGSKSKNQKGCAMCSPHKDHRCGRAAREPWAVLRTLGSRRRISRGDLQEVDDEYDAHDPYRWDALRMTEIWDYVLGGDSS